MTPLFLGQSLWSHLLVTCALLLLLMGFAWLLMTALRKRERQDDD